MTGPEPAGRLQALAERAVTHWRNLCADAGIDPDQQLAEAQLGYGMDAVTWIVTSLTAHHENGRLPTDVTERSLDLALDLIADEPDAIPLATALYTTIAPVTSATFSVAHIARYATDPELRVAYLTHPAGRVRAAALKHPDTTIAELETGATDPDSGVRGAVAGHRRAPVHLLVALAADRNPKVRYWAAINPNLPPEQLELLARDEDSGVRLGYARSAGAQRETLRALACDPNENVRQAVAAHRNTPGDARLQLVDDEHPDVAMQARTRLGAR